MKPQPAISSGAAVFILAAAAILSLCALPAAAVSVTDDSGTVLVLNETPLRIVSLAPSNTEILFALGLKDRVVGVTDVCNYPPEAGNITRIGGYSAISIEKVAALRPDVVLASDITPQATVNQLRSLGLTVMVVAPRNISCMIDDIRTVGRATGRDAAAEELAGTLVLRLSAVASCPAMNGRPTVAHVVWHDPIYVSGNDTLQNDVITRAGGVNVFAERSGWGTVSLEEFLLKNPDIIIVNGGGGMDTGDKDVIYDAFMNSPQFASLSAVKNHRVYVVSADVISRGGPRIVDAVERVAALVHPECSDGGNAAPPVAGKSTPSSPGFSAASCIALFGAGAVIRRMRGPW